MSSRCIPNRSPCSFETNAKIVIPLSNNDRQQRLSKGHEKLEIDMLISTLDEIFKTKRHAAFGFRYHRTAERFMAIFSPVITARQRHLPDNQTTRQGTKQSGLRLSSPTAHVEPTTAVTQPSSVSIDWTNTVDGSEFSENRVQTNRQSFGVHYTEIHHICRKSMQPENFDFFVISFMESLL